MALDPRYIWIGLIAVAVLLAIVLIARSARRSRTVALRDQFGGEYDDAVSTTGSRKRAENELLARAAEVKQFDVVPLSAADRDRYARDWNKVEQHFVERPTMAVAEADEVVADVMRVMGYPMGDFEKHAAHLSVTHPRVVAHYRAGHRVITGAPGSASTEDLRQAMLHYRALFEELIGQRTDVVRDVPRADEIATARTDARDPRNDRELRH
jgi:hypothetical protein